MVCDSWILLVFLLVISGAPHFLLSLVKPLRPLAVFRLPALYVKGQNL